MKDFYLNAEQKNRQRQAKELERLIYFGSQGQDYDIDKDVLNYFEQPEKNMKQTLSLDLNVLDLCTIEQLKDISTLIENIKAKKQNQKTSLEQEHLLRVKEEKKQQHKKEIENKRKFYDAVQERINQQEKWLQNQRLLLLKINDDYLQLKKEYDNEYRNKA